VLCEVEVVEEHLAVDVADRTDDDDSRLSCSLEASCSSVVRAKCPRWLVANWSSQPSFVRSSGVAMMPALLTRMSSGPDHRLTKAATDIWSERSSCSTKTFVFLWPQ